MKEYTVDIEDQPGLPGSGFGLGSGPGRGIAGFISGTKRIHDNKQVITVFLKVFTKSNQN